MQLKMAKKFTLGFTQKQFFTRLRPLSPKGRGNVCVSPMIVNEGGLWPSPSSGLRREFSGLFRRLLWRRLQSLRQARRVCAVRRSSVPGSIKVGGFVAAQSFTNIGAQQGLVARKPAQRGDVFHGFDDIGGDAQGDGGHGAVFVQACADGFICKSCRINNSGRIYRVYESCNALSVGVY